MDLFFDLGILVFYIEAYWILSYIIIGTMLILYHIIRAVLIAFFLISSGFIYITVLIIYLNWSPYNHKKLAYLKDELNERK